MSLHGSERLLRATSSAQRKPVPGRDVEFAPFVALLVAAGALGLKARGDSR
jgi:hypothetical protein